MAHNNEPITDGATPIFTPKADGVLPAYDIRTDRFNIALDATDKFNRSEITKRVNMKVVKNDDVKGSESAGERSAEPSQ